MQNNLWLQAVSVVLCALKNASVAIAVLCLFTSTIKNITIHVFIIARRSFIQLISFGFLTVAYKLPLTVKEEWDWLAVC